MTKLKEIIFIITGTTRGLGFSIASLVKRHGISLIEINRDNVKNSLSFVCDLSSPREVIRVLPSITSLINDKYKSYTVVFVSNAAVITPIGPLGTYENESLVNSVNTNIISPLLLINSIMSLPNRKIIYDISSGAAESSNEGLGIYSGSKSAMKKIIEISQKEAHSESVYFRSFDPGVMDTGMQKIMRSSSKYLKRKSYFVGLKNQGMLKDPSEVANAILNEVNELVGANIFGKVSKYEKY
jgi:benzil reductase ((S)-benzoin forming)